LLTIPLKQGVNEMHLLGKPAAKGLDGADRGVKPSAKNAMLKAILPEPRGIEEKIPVG
jgi:hypothetical protein